MSNYSVINDFAAKDLLLTGDPEKVIQGADLADELNAISTAISSKPNSANASLTGTATAENLTVTGTLTANIAGGVF